MNDLNNLSECAVGVVVDYDEVFKVSDWCLFEEDLGYASVSQGVCVRFERDTILKDKWCIKEVWEAY